ncbi:uncharacterized protein LOC115156670 isoform X1 [Salmo trutta]|uniref:uncharacterized protein LOC115156670 isoform X1 n=1 Tax=Salmo trutta TaxID=8032 RepID=UPI001131ED72|nr:uncharacterized protein LOC115156670 isoform X1 [Salmo trutta]
MAMPQFGLLLSLISTALILLHIGNCLQMDQQLCHPECIASSSPDISYQRGVRYTYRYSTTIATTLQGSTSGRNGLALDCVVDIDLISKCHLMMQIRNPQIKRLSPQKEHSVQRLKSLRESLERSRLKFSLQGGKVTALCPQEGEQLWTLNIKRALLSMLQTSRTAEKQEVVKETDLYGTCTSKYERRGPLLVKTRNLRQCQQDRLAYFWPNSTPLREDTTVDSNLQCTQRHGTTVMEEVNCTEIISMVPLSGSTGVVKTQTVSTLTLLRAQKGTPSGLDTLGPGVLSDLQFVEEGAEGQVRGRTSSPQEATDTVRKLCGLTSDQQQLSELFLHLAFQLRALSLPQLRTLWHDASFKCRNDWQPLLDGLPACGSEECIALLTDLIRDEEIEQQRAHSFLTAIALIPHPSPHTVGSVSALLKTPEVWTKALLTGSSLVHQLCRRSQSPCSLIPQVQSFIQALKDTLGEGCGGDKTELLYALKAVGNAGVAASALIPQLNLCIQSQSTPLELRLTAVQAFRRIPCNADRRSVLRLYRDHQEEAEVRIAAYQQIMHCPDPEVLRAVKTTLRHETSSQVGSFVWSHLTQVLRTEDPMKQALMEALPDDIITKDFEAEPWKYSSYSDYTADSGFGVANMEGALVFSSESFVPRYAMANLTVYIHGRAFNLLEVDLRVENIEPLLKHIFGHKSTSPDEEPTTRDEEEDGKKSPMKERRRRKAGEGNKGQIKERRRRKAGERDSSGCSPSIYGYLSQVRTMFSGGRLEEARPRCWLGVKVFGNELSVVTCADLYSQIKELSLSMAGLAVRLLKGQGVQLHHRAVLMTEELVLPSLSGLPIRLGINMTSLLSLHLKGSANYRDWSHFSLAGHIKPNAYVGLSARMGVDGVLGRAGVEWATELRTSSSLDGSVHLQEGHGLRVALNTPEDLMDIVSLSSRMYHVNGDHREQMRGPKSRVERTICTPKTWSKMVGWQLCSNVSYPLSSTGLTFLPPGPVHLSLRLLKLDRGLHQYLLEAAYSLLTQSGSWLPREASLHLLLATPHSSIPRDMSLDLALSPHRLLLKMTHPLKTLTVQGQLDQVRNICTGQLELLIDNVHQYYIMGLIDSQTLLSEQRLRYHLEAKVGAESRPMILSANLTRGLGRKTSLSATLKNVFREAASFSVVLERRLDDGRRQYSVEAELLLPGVVGSRILGLMEQKGPLWSSALRLKYGLREDSRHLRQECHTSQSLRSEREPNQTYRMRAEHEFYCSSTAHINHKVQLRHEESPSHTKSSVDVSYGKHWDEINNKHRLLLNQSFRNQSRHNLTSYVLEFSLQVPDRRLNYKTQLMHSHLRQRGAESSTHLKVNYNDQMPLVAGLHWKDTSKAMFRNWEGMFNMDTPWLYMYTTHKLSQPQRHTYQLTSELTARKWLTVRNLALEGYYRDRSKDREARLHLYAPAVTYLKAVGWGMVAKQGLKASCTISSVWSPALRGDLSLENTKQGRTLQLASSYGKHNLSLTAGLTTLDKNLRKRMVMMKMTLSEPKSPTMELELEGGVEELRKDKQIYQKRALLLLRQPFQKFLQSFLLQETFTVDLHKGLYILESKAHLYSNRDIIHTVTLGYQQPSPFVCSSLTHPFSYDVIPPDSEVCVTMFSNQTQREVRGRVRIGKKDRLTFLGQIQLNPSDLPQHRVKVRANLTHLLQLFQLKLPSSAILEGDVSWNPKNNSVFDYLVRGKVGINRQECQFSVNLNGSSDRIGLYSSLTHPFQSKILKTLEARLTADTSMVDGGVSSSLCVRADGKDRALLEAQLSHSLQRDTRALSIRLALLQTLLPTSATELQLNMSANISSDKLSVHGSYDQGGEVLQAQVAGSLEHSPGSPWLRMAVTGGLRHSLPSLTALPPALSLEGALGQSDWLTEGQLRVTVSKAVYSVELSHQQDQGDTWEEEDGMLGKEPDAASDWLCARAGEESLCVNVSRRLGSQARGGVNAQLSHSSRWLRTAGVPGNSSAQVSWTQEEGRLSVLAELQTGAHGLKAEFERARTGGASPRWELQTRVQHQSKALVQRGLPSSIQATGHYQEETEHLSAGLAIAVEEHKKVDILVEAGKGNNAANLTVSLLHHLRQLKGIIPTPLQMSCTGYATNGAANDRLSAQCSGSVAGRPVETLLPPYFSVNGSLVRSGCTTRLDTHLHTGGEERGAASLALSSCLPQLSLRSSIRHSLAGLHALGLPPRSALVLGISTGERPGVGVELELGQCRIRADSGENKANWVVNVTHYCPELQSTGLPASLAFQGLLSLVPCQLAVHCTLKLDNRDLTLELGQSCSPAAHLSGSLTHSFPGLRTRGLPLKTSIEAWAPEGPGQFGALLIKADSCHIRANGDMGSNGRTQWATESDCPLLQGLDLPSQVHLNGSVGTDDHNVWVAILDASVDGQQRGSLRLTAGARSGLRLEGHLSHNVTALEGIPGQSRIVVTGSGRADSQGYDTEVELQLGGCAVRGSATVMTRDNLKGAVVYHNNCTALQEWGSPVKMEVSWSLVITQTLLDTHVSMAMDEKKLQALLALKTTKGWQEASAHLNHSVPLLERVGLPANSAMATRSESHGNGSYHWLLHCIVGSQQFIEEMTVERSQRMVRVKSIANHTMELLKNWGLPENNRIQLELDSGQVRNLTIQSQFGAQLAGLGLQLKDSPLATELRGNMWHSWLWLQERGFPQTMEALCSTHRVLSQLRSMAHLSVDGHRLLGLGLNVSVADGHLAMLLSLTPLSSPRTDLPYSLDTALTAQFTGPMRSVSVDLHCKGRRVRFVGDVRGWRTYGGSREARATIQHSLQGQTSPILQVEAWGRLTDSQLRCSVAVNPELSSSVALIIQGHHLPDSKELMVKVIQNIPQLLLYLPTQLNTRSQLNQSGSSVRGMVELQSGKRKLWALGELAVTKGGYRQALELNHSYPQLKPLPRNIAVKMLYEARNWSHQLRHWAVWGSQEFNMAGLYSAPPGPQLGDRTLKVQIASLRHGCSLDVALERSLHGRLDSVVLGWNRHGRQEEVRALSLWRAQGESSETTMELRQPFTPTLSQLYLHTISHASATEQRSNHQTHVSWDSGSPVNVSLTLSQQWLNSFSRGQACARFSPAQEVVPSLVAVEGCVSVAKEGNSYSQNAELKWGDKSLRQSMNYQWSATGLHTLQLEAGAENVSPAPCPSHTLLAQFHTNLRDRMEHHIQVGLCPPHLSLGWSGYHRVNIGTELLYTKTRLSLAGQPHCSLTLALTNSSTAHSTNISLVTESKVGNWSVKVGGSALSSLLGPGLQIQVILDRREQVWLRGALEGRCLHATAGYGNGIGPDQDLTVALCLEGWRKLGLTLEVLRREDGTLLESLTSVSVGTANQSLLLRARGCAESLLAVEAQVHHLGSQMRKKILERVQTLQHLLTEFGRQSKDIELLQELSGAALRFTQRTEALLGQREGGAWGSWRTSRLRHALTHSLPRLLLLLQHASQLGQHELRRPLATIAGAYHDVTGQKVDSVWREAVSVWTDRLVELLPPLQENPHLRPVAQFTLTTLSTVLDVVSHQTGHWAELRLAVALVGVRRRLASVYKLSASDCSVSVTIPLPLARGPWSRMEKVGVVEVLLEEWLLRPLQALTSLRPTAELYRLKRKITDSPFCHEALLVANQFVVSFDGHLYELPGPCPVILAHDVTQDESFTVLLGSDSSSQRTLLVRMNNSTVAIHHNGEVKFNCHVTQTSYSDNGLVIRKEGNVVEVSNRNGARVSCDLSLALCSLTLDGWLHGVSTGVLGTNDNEAGNDFPLPDGSQADNMADFMHSWQISPECGSVPQIAEPCSKSTADSLSCDFLFSARDSPLGSCFRVVDPGQFLSVCERSHCGSVSGRSGAPCKLAAAFVYLCQRNYVPLELPVQCIRV